MIVEGVVTSAVVPALELSATFVSVVDLSSLLLQETMQIMDTARKGKRRNLKDFIVLGLRFKE